MRGGRVQDLVRDQPRADLGQVNWGTLLGVVAAAGF